MPRPRLGIAVGLVGAAVLVSYLVVRLWFMAQLDAAVAQANVHSVGDILANLSPALAAWLLWTYSFRPGMLLAVIAGGLYSGIGKGGLWLLGGGGLVYLATCYLPFVDYSPRYYGVLGTAILVLFVFLVWDWARGRAPLRGPARLAGDLRMAGLFFLVMATWSLCGIFGIVTYALQPEVMLARGLQPAAVMLTTHVMAELTLGWFLLFLGSRRERAAKAADTGASRAGTAATSVA
jgi:hypothetical protein